MAKSRNSSTSPRRDRACDGHVRRRVDESFCLRFAVVSLTKRPAFENAVKKKRVCARASRGEWPSIATASLLHPIVGKQFPLCLFRAFLVFRRRLVVSQRFSFPSFLPALPLLFLPLPFLLYIFSFTFLAETRTHWHVSCNMYRGNAGIALSYTTSLTYRSNSATTRWCVAADKACAFAPYFPRINRVCVTNASTERDRIFL